MVVSEAADPLMFRAEFCIEKKMGGLRGGVRSGFSAASDSGNHDNQRDPEKVIANLSWCYLLELGRGSSRLDVEEVLVMNTARNKGTHSRARRRIRGVM